METKKPSVHEVLARSYSIYLIGVFIGLVVDYFYPVRVISNEVGSAVGLILLVLGGILILWAQKTSSKLRGRPQPLQMIDFKKGPYSYTRQPTNVGLTMLTLGFAFVENSLILIVAVLISFTVSLKFIRKEESILGERYGEIYLNYKKEVKRWF